MFFILALLVMSVNTMYSMDQISELQNATQDIIINTKKLSLIALSTFYALQITEEGSVEQQYILLDNPLFYPEKVAYTNNHYFLLGKNENEQTVVAALNVKFDQMHYAPIDNLKLNDITKLTISDDKTQVFYHANKRKTPISWSNSFKLQVQDLKKKQFSIIYNPPINN